MQLLPCLLFGISASLDGLLVGISFGLRQIKILLWQNLLISFVTLFGTYLAGLTGVCLLPLFPSRTGNGFGSLVLVFLGVYYIIKWFLSLLRKRRSTSGDGELSQACVQESLSLQKVCFLSLALSANNIGIGLSASLAGLPLIPTAFSTLVCSILFLFAGNRMGRSRLLRFIGNAADPISGLLLVGLGALQLLFEMSLPFLA